MLLEQNIEKAKFILSKDEIGYSEVLNDFKNSNEIYILTFNISAKKDDLIKRLEELDSEVKIHIITNIPQRYPRYFGLNARKRARDNINIYMSKLSPSQFEAQLIPFFNFNNHAKIIATDRIAYIGSANFSDESANNFETGLVIKDRSFIVFLKNHVFPELINHSEPYFEDEFMEFKIFIPNILSRLPNFYDRFINEFYDYDDHSQRFYNPNMEFNVDITELESLTVELLDLKEIIETIDSKSHKTPKIKELKNFINKSKIEKILELIDYNNSIFEACNFNYQEFCDNYLEEHSLEAYDEHLDEYCQKASEEASDAFEEIARKSEKDINELTTLFGELIGEISVLIEKIHELSDVNQKIDNT